MLLTSFFFFFFKQKTAYEMRISDWSSDVCSSDLLAVILRLPRVFLGIGRLAQRLRHLRDREIGGGIFQRTRGILVDSDIVRPVAALVVIFDALAPDRADHAALLVLWPGLAGQHGTASWWERVW